MFVCFFKDNKKQRWFNHTNISQPTKALTVWDGQANRPQEKEKKQLQGTQTDKYRFVHMK